MATSYSNSGGQGNRTALIDSSYTGISGGCFPTNPDLSSLLDGSHAPGSCVTSTAWDGTNTAVELIFDFRAGNSVVIDEFTWYQDTASTHGIWNFAGSNTGTSYVDLAVGITLGGAPSQAYSFSNTIGYRYYKLYQTGGTTSSGPWLEEIEFKIEGAPGFPTYDAVGGRGNRSSIITATDSGISGGCNGGPNTFAPPLVDGSFVNGCSTAAAWGGSNTASVLIFDFGGMSVIISEFAWYQDLDATHGLWNFAGSNDGVSYTDLLTNAALGVTNGYGQAVFSFANSTAYQFYKLYQVSGTSSATSWNREIEFMIGAVPGVMFVVEASDVFAAIGYSGIPGIHGDLLVTEAKDIFAAVGSPTVVGLFAATEVTDHFSAFGFQPLTGTLHATEAPDSFHGTGIGLGEDGIFITTEAVDIFSAIGNTPISGTFDTTEAADRFFAIGAGVTQVRRRRTLIVT